MLRLILLSFVVVLIGALASVAQSYPGAANCFDPLLQKVDEFVFTSDEEFEQRTAKFLKTIEAAGGPATGWVNVYGGRIATSNEVERLSDKLKRVAAWTIGKLTIVDRGYRVEPSYEFFLRTLNCTAIPVGIADLRVDEIEFTDIPSIRVASSDINSHIRFTPEALCSPAGRAVRACGEGTEVDVFIVIDEKGTVIFARAIDGHPLNRQNAANAARQYKFTPFLIDGVGSRVSGTMKVVYTKSPEIITN